jgi:hypothetical protein
MSNANELEAIRARHKTADARFVVQGITLDGAAVPRAHADRATLLRLLDAAREELREVREAGKPFLKYAIEPTITELETGATSLTRADLRRLAAALKAPPSRAQGESS